MMRRLLLLLLLIMGSIHTAFAAPSLTPWNVSATYPGDAQYDPRLEQTIQFWGAGIPLAKVFAEVKTQTGVEIGFDPPGDDNERICVNLFLNPKDPPTLRDLLAQLDWVTDCRFAVSDQGERTRYYLLGTKAGEGALERFYEARKRSFDDEAHAELQQWLQLREEALKKLEALRYALGLSREEAIAKYHGVDDLMLLALLDPPRRAMGEFLCSLPREKLAPDPTRLEGDERLWKSLTASQKEWLRLAGGTQLEQKVTELKQDQWGNPSEAEGWEWLAQQKVELQFFFDGGGGFHFSINVWDKSVHGRGSRGLSLPFLQLRPSTEPIFAERNSARNEIDLRRALGEIVSEEEARQLINEASLRGDVRQHEWSQQQRLQEARYRLRKLSRLSEAAKAQLSSLPMPFSLEQSYTLWQIQEAVAVLSGKSIVSDCFWQPVVTPMTTLSFLSPEQTHLPTALAFLEGSVMAWKPSPGNGNDTIQLWSTLDVMVATILNQWGSPALLLWEWGDAGNILHFRSVQRDLWREAFLSPNILIALDSWLAPYLPTPEEESITVTVPLDLRRVGAQLTWRHTLQDEWGCEFIYADPTDPTECWRHQFRRAVYHATIRMAFLRLFSQLSDEQWQQLNGEGWIWQDELRLRPTDKELDFVFMLEVQKGDLFRLEAKAPEQLTRELATFDPNFPENGWYVLTHRREGKIHASALLPTEMTLCDIQPTYLLPKPE